MIIYLPVPANDNALGKVRPLTPDDVSIILEEHGLVLACALDNAAKYQNNIDDPIKAVVRVLLNMPRLQRDIVWRGSWLKRADVDRLAEGASLSLACTEVIEETRAHYPPGALENIIKEKLKRFSRVLREGNR